MVVVVVVVVVVVECYCIYIYILLLMSLDMCLFIICYENQGYFNVFFFFNIRAKFQDSPKCVVAPGIHLVLL